MTKRAAIIGHPVGHSKSPAIHNYWIAKHGIDAVFEAIDVAPGNLEKEMIRLADEKYAGFSITLPHKERAFEICDELDETAKEIGAVNMVAVKKGKLLGTNTDAFGFTENIKAHAPAFDFKTGPVVVLGAGGAARAVVYALLKAGAPEIRIANRTLEKAQVLARDFKKLRPVEWDKRSEVLNDVALLVNTTQLGMSGQPKLEMDLSRLHSAALVTDIVYAPLKTDLLKSAEMRGNITVTGIGMLLHQARPAFKAWFGVMPEVDKQLEEIALR